MTETKPSTSSNCISNTTATPFPNPMVNLEGMHCGICFDSYSKVKKAPITLTCGHSFCRICVLKLGENKARVTCGVCRADTRCVAKRLGKNYQLIDMLDKLNMLQDDDKVTDDVIDVETLAQNDAENEANPQQDRDSIRTSLEPAESLFDSLRNRLESLQPQIIARNGRDAETYIFPRMQDRYDMIKEDLEHLEEKLEEIREEYENVNTEITNLSEDLSDNSSNRGRRRSRLHRYSSRLDRQARNLFGPIFRFGHGGTRSIGRHGVAGRGRSASLSSDDGGFVFGRINPAPAAHNQINIVFGDLGDNRIRINENSTNDYEEVPDYSTFTPTWPISPELHAPVLDIDMSYITRSVRRNPQGIMMARCFLCDTEFFDSDNAIRTHVRGSRHRELFDLNRQSNLETMETDGEGDLVDSTLSSQRPDSDMMSIFNDISSTNDNATSEDILDLTDEPPRRRPPSSTTTTRGRGGAFAPRGRPNPFRARYGQDNTTEASGRYQPASNDVRVQGWARHDRNNQRQARQNDTGRYRTTWGSTANNRDNRSHGSRWGATNDNSTSNTLNQLEDLWGIDVSSFNADADANPEMTTSRRAYRRNREAPFEIDPDHPFHVENPEEFGDSTNSRRSSRRNRDPVSDPWLASPVDLNEFLDTHQPMNPNSSNSTWSNLRNTNQSNTNNTTARSSNNQSSRSTNSPRSSGGAFSRPTPTRASQGGASPRSNNVPRLPDLVAGAETSTSSGQTPPSKFSSGQRPTTSGTAGSNNQSTASRSGSQSDRSHTNHRRGGAFRGGRGGRNGGGGGNCTHSWSTWD